MPNLALNMHACLQMQHSQYMISLCGYSEKAKKFSFYLALKATDLIYLNSETTHQIDLTNMKNFHLYYILIS